MPLTKCEYVYDGDTIRTTEGRIRLCSIDAPESKQPLGAKAKALLSKLILYKTITIVPIEKDRYDRLVAQVICQNFDISEMLVLAGLAYPYFPDVINASRIERAADYAKKLKLGIWAGYNERPQDFRKRTSIPAYNVWSAKP